MTGRAHLRAAAAARLRRALEAAVVQHGVPLRIGPAELEARYDGPPALAALAIARCGPILVSIPGHATLAVARFVDGLVRIDPPLDVGGDLLEAERAALDRAARFRPAPVVPLRRSSFVSSTAAFEEACSAVDEALVALGRSLPEFDGPERTEALRCFAAVVREATRAIAPPAKVRP